MRFAKTLSRVIFASLSMAAVMASAQAADHVVEIREFTFEPADLEIRTGDTVTWVNYDVAPHTATAESGSWDSSQLDEGAQWSFTFNEPAVYDYLCSYHPAMVGSVRVSD